MLPPLIQIVTPAHLPTDCHLGTCVSPDLPSCLRCSPFLPSRALSVSLPSLTFLVCVLNAISHTGHFSFFVLSMASFFQSRCSLVVCFDFFQPLECLVEPRMYSLLECVVNTQAMAAEGGKDGRNGSQRGLEEKSR